MPRLPALLCALTLPVLLTACDSAAADPAALPQIAVGLVQQEQATAPETVLIDVRTPEEFAEGHITGARNIDVKADGFAAAIAMLPRDGRYIVYCRSGNRSGRAQSIMAEAGFTSVTNMEGGIQAWNAAGLPVEAPAEDPAP